MKGIYREDGAKILVEVLSDETKPADDGRMFRAVHLRQIQVLRSSPFIRDSPNGHEWTSEVALDAGPYLGMLGWSLELLPDPDDASQAATL